MEYWNVVENKTVGGGDVCSQSIHSFKNEANARKFYTEWTAKYKDNKYKDKKGTWHFLELPEKVTINFDDDALSDEDDKYTIEELERYND